MVQISSLGFVKDPHAQECILRIEQVLESRDAIACGCRTGGLVQALSNLPQIFVDRNLLGGDPNRIPLQLKVVLIVANVSQLRSKGLPDTVFESVVVSFGLLVLDEDLAVLVAFVHPSQCRVPLEPGPQASCLPTQRQWIVINVLHIAAEDQVQGALQVVGNDLDGSPGVDQLGTSVHPVESLLLGDLNRLLSLQVDFGQVDALDPSSGLEDLQGQHVFGELGQKRLAWQDHLVSQTLELLFAIGTGARQSLLGIRIEFLDPLRSGLKAFLKNVYILGQLVGERLEFRRIDQGSIESFDRKQVANFRPFLVVDLSQSLELCDALREDLLEFFDILANLRKVFGKKRLADIFDRFDPATDTLDRLVGFLATGERTLLLARRRVRLYRALFEKPGVLVPDFISKIGNLVATIF